MYKTSRFFCYILSFSILGLSDIHAQCDKILSDLYDYDMSIIQSKAYYMKYSLVATKGEETSQELVSEIWYKEGNVRYENAYSLMLEDKKVSIILSKQKKQIIIMSAKEAPSEKPPLLGLMAQLDTLKRIAIQQSCAKSGNIEVITFSFPDEQKYEYMPYRKVELYYDHSLKRQISGKYYLCTDRGGRIETYQYLALDVKSTQAVEMNPLTEIYTGTKLKPKYAGFKVVDMRNAKKSK